MNICVPSWVNGFLTAAILVDLALMGRALWFHDSDSIATTVVVLLAAMFFWAGSFYEANK